MTDVLLWLWLQNRLGYASYLGSEIIRYENAARLIYESSESQLREMNIFPEQIIRRLRDHSLEIAERIYIRCLALGHYIITPDNDNYPIRLRLIEDPPLVLFACGDVTAMNYMMSIAVVGTRKASRYNMSVAQEVGYRLGKAGAAVVSGCAVGIDAASQSGAVAAGGVTIGVLGCGLDSPYNRPTKELREAITLNGVLISEYPPGTEARPEHFPQRNRIISGLALGVLVVEAGKRSGSLITAGLALEQGRDLFAYYSESNLGTLASIHSLGESNVTLIVSPSELLLPYMGRFGAGICLDGTDEPLRSRPELMPQNIGNIISDMAAQAKEAQIREASGQPKFPESFRPVSEVPAKRAEFIYDDLPSEKKMTAENGERRYSDDRESTVDEELKSYSEKTEKYITSSNIDREYNENSPTADQNHTQNLSIERVISKARKIGLTAEQIAALSAELESNDHPESASKDESAAVTAQTEIGGSEISEHDPLPADISDEARRLYAILREHSDTIDNLAVLAGLTISMAAEFILELELYGVIHSKPGGIYAVSEYFYQ